MRYYHTPRTLPRPTALDGSRNTVPGGATIVSELVLSERRGPVLEITLNQPERLNALTPGMRDDVARLLDEAGIDPDVSVVVVRGAGRAFCSGFDLTTPVNWERLTAQQWRQRLSGGLESFFLRFWRCPRPIVAAVHGHAIGAGWELLTMCDFVIAAEDTVFGQPEIRFGSAPEVLGLPFRVGMAAARDILLTGRNVSAQEAMAMGFLTRVVPLDELDATVEQVTNELVAIDPLVLELNKASLNRAYELMGFLDVLHSHIEIGSVLNVAYSADAGTFYELQRREGLNAAIAWREARFAASRDAASRDAVSPQRAVEP